MSSQSSDYHFHWSKADRRAYNKHQKSDARSRLANRNRKVQRMTRNAFIPRGLVKA